MQRALDVSGGELVVEVTLCRPPGASPGSGHIGGAGAAEGSQSDGSPRLHTKDFPTDTRLSA